jgi:hypothetical protein
LKWKLIALNLLLLAAIGAVLWQARVRVEDTRAERRASLGVRARPSAPPPPIATPRPDAPPAAKYAEVAEKNLFSKDRNPNVIIEPPKIEQPKQKEMPPLPVVYGVLGLSSGIKALMAEKPGLASRPVHAGDTVGEFKIASLDAQNVTFDWEGKEVARKIDDLMDRTGRNTGGGTPAIPPAQVLNPLPGPPPVQQQQPQPQQQPGNPPAANAMTGSPIGGEVGAPGRSEKMCRGGDSSPPGTVIDGYKKVLTQTPFGTNCRWVPVQ